LPARIRRCLLRSRALPPCLTPQLVDLFESRVEAAERLIRRRHLFRIAWRYLARHLDGCGTGGLHGWPGLHADAGEQGSAVGSAFLCSEEFHRLTVDVGLD